MMDSLFSNAAWLFFVAWSVVVAAVSIAAFGRDLLPSRIRLDSSQNASSTDNAHPVTVRIR